MKLGSISFNTIGWIVGLAALIAAVCFGWWMRRQCYVPVSPFAIKSTDPVECFELWFYRYQTLLAGVLALIAALVASLPVKRQLREMSRQTAASATAILERSKRKWEFNWKGHVIWAPIEDRTFFD